MARDRTAFRPRCDELEARLSLSHLGHPATQHPRKPTRVVVDFLRSPHPDTPSRVVIVDHRAFVVGWQGGSGSSPGGSRPASGCEPATTPAHPPHAGLQAGPEAPGRGDQDARRGAAPVEPGAGGLKGSRRSRGGTAGGSGVARIARPPPRSGGRAAASILELLREKSTQPADCRCITPGRRGPAWGGGSIPHTTETDDGFSA